MRIKRATKLSKYAKKYAQKVQSYYGVWGNL